MATDEERDGDRTKITLAAHGGLIKVEIAPGLDKGIVISADDGEVALGLRISVEEQESVIEAIRRAQGRPGPTSTPLEERIAKAIAEADEEADAQAIKNAETQDLADGRGAGLRAALAMVREQGATVPRAGVARVLAIHAQIAETNLGEYRDGLIDLLLSELDKVRAGIDAPAPITVTVRRHQNDFRVYASYAKNRSVVVIDEHPGSWRVLSVTGDGDGCIVKLESWRADTGATLEAAGLWPVAAPATTALRGELLMSGQTEAIDALDRLAKDGER